MNKKEYIRKEGSPEGDAPKEFVMDEAEKKLVAKILGLLCDTQLPQPDEYLRERADDKDFQQLYNVILDIRELTASLSKGELHKFVYGRGYTISNLKTLQANLRHIAWQIQEIADGDFSQRVEFMGDFSEAFNNMTDKLKAANTSLVNLANKDALTAIPNRLALIRFLEKGYIDSIKLNQPLSVMVFDIDFFKQVNDTYGHAAGDEVLRGVSALISKTFRTNDIFGRYGGEEFMAVMPGTDAERAFMIAERARTALEAAKITVEQDLELSITISVGVTERSAEDRSYDDMVNRADRALYISKNSGRNRSTRL